MMLERLQAGPDAETDDVDCSLPHWRRTGGNDDWTNGQHIAYTAPPYTAQEQAHFTITLTQGRRGKRGRGGGQLLHPLNFWLSENYRKELFVGKILSKNTKFGAKS